MRTATLPNDPQRLLDQFSLTVGAVHLMKNQIAYRASKNPASKGKAEVLLLEGHAVCNPLNLSVALINAREYSHLPPQ
jgi:hypothetical protein